MQGSALLAATAQDRQAHERWQRKEPPMDESIGGPTTGDQPAVIWNCQLAGGVSTVSMR